MNIDIDALARKYVPLLRAREEMEQELTELNTLIGNDQNGFWRKSDYQKELEKNLQRGKYELRRSDEIISDIYEDYLDHLIIVRGTLDQFEQLAGFPVKLVDIGSADKGVKLCRMTGFNYDRPSVKNRFGDLLDPSLRTSPLRLLENGVVGIVNAEIQEKVFDRRYHDGIDYWPLYKITNVSHYGLPVCKR